MSRTLYVYDSRTKWLEPPLRAARARGWNARELPPHAMPAGFYDGAYAMVHVHADPGRLPTDRIIAHEAARAGATMVTDLGQVDVYEWKREQYRRWGALMPRTWVLESLDEANRFTAGYDGPFPIVSKADVGASSYNVRIIQTRAELLSHVAAAFTAPGIPVKCCAGEKTQAYQHGYVLLQEFIPHRDTCRVNRVGDQYAIFLRHCYPDRPVAQTGNVTPVGALTDEHVALLNWAVATTDVVGSKWVAIDALRVDAGDGYYDWRLLETSLRWPHPGARDCDAKAKFFARGGPNEGWEPTRSFGEMWEVLMDELEAGAFEE